MSKHQVLLAIFLFPSVLPGGDEPSRFREAARKALPAVVSVRAEWIAPIPPVARVTAVQRGAGVILDAERGWVLTSTRLLADERRVLIVTLPDGRQVTPTAVRRDDRSGLALLRITGDKNLPEVEWGDGDALDVGDWVLALGHPSRQPRRSMRASSRARTVRRRRHLMTTCSRAMRPIGSAVPTAARW